MNIFILLYVAILLCFSPNNAFSKEGVKRDILEVKITIKDHLFIPDKVIVPEGKKLRLIIHNQDNSVEEFESFDLKREKIIPGRTKARIIIAPLRKGVYSFFGEFHEDTARGSLVVVSEDQYEDSNNLEN